jgi:hypothetical protein
MGGAQFLEGGKSAVLAAIVYEDDFVASADVVQHRM